MTESYHPVLGGGEQHIRSLAGRLVQRGLACTVLTRRGDASWPAEEADQGVRVLRVAPGGPARRGKYGMVPFALRALVRERSRFDLLVVRGTRVLGLPAVLAARALGRPVVLQAEVNGEMSGEVYTWGTSLARPPWSRLVAGAVALRNHLLRDAEAFVAMSRQIAREFAEAGVEPARIALIPHGVDTGRFCPVGPGEKGALRAEMGLPADARLLVYTGRLLRGKGLEDLVEAFARLAGEHPSAQLALVGSGAGQALSVEEALKADVARRGLAGRVHFPGRVEAVERWLQAGDVFVFPSVFEALGLSLVEAAACGLACVGARTGGIVDVIEEGRNGRLFAPGDVTALAGLLDQLLRDPGERARLGAEARAVARARFDLDDSVLRYAALFAELSWRSDGRPRARAPRAGAAPPRSPAAPA